MTDICDELRASINKVWPKATLLQRSTSMRKSMEFPKDDKIFRAVLYANDFESHEKAYKDLADSSSKTQKYNNFLKITRNYLITASAWLDASEKISW